MAARLLRKATEPGVSANSSALQDCHGYRWADLVSANPSLMRWTVSAVSLARAKTSAGRRALVTRLRHRPSSQSPNERGLKMVAFVDCVKPIFHPLSVTEDGQISWSAMQAKSRCLGPTCTKGRCFRQQCEMGQIAIGRRPAARSRRVVGRHATRNTLGPLRRQAAADVFHSCRLHIT